MAWTKNGTVSVANGSAVIYGAGTTWASDKVTCAGDTFKAPDGRYYEVLSVQSNTQATLASPYLGVTASGQPYALIHTGLLPAELAVAISDLQSKYLATVSQLYEWETSAAETVPLTNPATGVTEHVIPLSRMVEESAKKAPKDSPIFIGPVTAPQYFNVTEPYGALQVGGADALRFGSDTSGQLAGFRNRIINGNSLIDQYSAFAPKALPALTYVFCGDRNQVAVDSGVNATCQVSIASLVGKKAIVITGGTGTTNPRWFQRVESRNCCDFAGKRISFSCLAYQNTGASVTLSGNVVRAKTADNFGETLSEGVITFANPVLPSGALTRITGTVDISSAGFTGLHFDLGFIGSLGNGFVLLLTDFQVELGSIATPFENRPVGFELFLCQRYYEVLGVMARTAVFSTHHWKANKRVTPTIVPVVPGTGAAYGALSNDPTGGVYQSGANSVDTNGYITGSAEL